MSRNTREGIYAGKRSGKHKRLARDIAGVLSDCLFPFSTQTAPLNRKQRKQQKLAEKIHW